MNRRKAPPLKVPSTVASQLPETSLPELLDQVRHENPTGWRDIKALKPHPSPSRGLDACHIVNLAHSIAALGLIHPLVVDVDDVVIAGSHRYASLRLLATPRIGRAIFLTDLCIAAGQAALTEALSTSLESLPYAPDTVDFSRIPVRIMPLRQSTQPEEVWRAEVAENERRRDYSPKEVKVLAERLLEQGYTMRKGGQNDARRVLPVLTAVVGRSERQVRRLLSAGEQSEERGVDEDRTSVRSSSEAMSLKTRVDAYRNRNREKMSDSDHRIVDQMLALLTRLAQG